MKKYILYKKQRQGFENVRNTIKVVEKAAASHIHLLKKQVENLKSYKDELEAALNNMPETDKSKNHFLLQPRTKGKKGLLAVGGDKGIAGDLYHRLVNRFLSEKNEYQEIWVLGRKMKKYFEAEGVGTRELFYENRNMLVMDNLQKISAGFLGLFQDKNWQSIDVLYPRFISLAVQQPALVRFLPFALERNKNFQAEIGAEGLPIFEPSRRAVFEILLKKYINVFLVQIIMEAKLSEFSARTVAAEDACSKTENIIQRLNLAFLKERKRSLTQKQLESFGVHKMI